MRGRALAQGAKLRSASGAEATEGQGVLTIEITGQGLASGSTKRKIATDVYTSQDRTALGPVQRRVSTPSRPNAVAAARVGTTFCGQTSPADASDVAGWVERRALAEAGSW